MIRRTKAVVALLGLTATIALVASSTGSASHDDFRMAFVTDIGSLQDKSFNQLGNEGRIRVGKQIGISTRVYVTNKAEDRLPNLLAAASAGYDLVVANGFFHAEHLDTVAPRFPRQKFVGIDVTKFLLPSGPSNYTGIVFSEHEGGYLVGYLAALTAKRTGGKQVISAVGANAVPAIVKYISGYIQGAKKANPKIKVIANYANDPTFSDQAKCKKVALRQIAQGSQAVFQVAGGCGLGALSAAKEKKVWGIGVDADQSYLGAHMLTSATKKVDLAVVIMTKRAHLDRLQGGVDFLFNVKNGGIGFGKVSPKVNKGDLAKANALKRQIAKGQIKIKPTIKF
ncbi:MAG: BMP family ABC transporter substrate-binding protein [Actinobacteria bacterium]|nr:BMP family ABC transporter substrate-binding protein [Actinomycetota bacterium]